MTSIRSRTTCAAVQEMHVETGCSPSADDEHGTVGVVHDLRRGRSEHAIEPVVAMSADDDDVHRKRVAGSAYLLPRRAYGDVRRLPDRERQVGDEGFDGLERVTPPALDDVVGIASKDVGRRLPFVGEPDRPERHEGGVQRKTESLGAQEHISRRKRIIETSQDAVHADASSRVVPGTRARVRRRRRTELASPTSMSDRP